MSPDVKALAPKLTKLMLLLLRSEQDNEALSARRKLTGLLRDNGLDAHDLVAALFAPESETSHQSNVQHAHMRPSDSSTVRWCYQRRRLLKAHDQEFIESLMRWSGPISGSQRQWLHDIVGKLGRAEAA
jgi:hypothetical protein